MSYKNGELKDLLGEARAIHYAMQHGAISYERAKYLTKPILDRINNAIGLIAKKHKVKPEYIRFHNLGWNL